MTDPRPYHVLRLVYSILSLKRYIVVNILSTWLLSYGTLLGVQFYQTFVSGVVAFRAIPRPQFAQLQTATFPIYFSLQSALPVVVALTASKGGQTHGISGLLAPENRKTLIPMATAVVTGLVNMFVLRPLTVNVMRERKQQESRDGKKSYDPAPHSKEMQALNKRFGRVHGISSLLNMVTLGVTIYYGTVIGKQLS